MLQAHISNIQKFSLHDGPGIRTVVFFKGCPLRCTWCANPETQEKALGCLPPTDGFDINGQLRTLEQVLAVCLQDRPFYEESSGGVTLSGGEPLLWPDFSLALLQALHNEGIHTALETTGFAMPQAFEKVANEADSLLFDMKHWDATRHRQGTGVENTQALANMKSAIAAGKEVLPRIPVIPGYNDSLADAAGFCRRLTEAGAKKAQLLPFHQFGEKKYSLLGRPYAFAGMPALHPEGLEPYRQAFLRGGVHAFF